MALTKREIQVLRMKNGGMTNQEVADLLCIDKRTVDYHLQNAYDDLGAPNIVVALNKAREAGYDLSGESE